MTESDWKNKLYFGDNLKILCDHIDDESVDLIYLDPPFNSNATYNVLFKEKSGESSAAQITAFEDTWHWGLESQSAYEEVVQYGPKKLSDLLQALFAFLGHNDMMAYLVMMAQRMVELHRVLKPTGSIYLHCDPTASHYLKLLLDAVFGIQNFRNEIVWQRTSSHNDSKKWGAVHDTIFYYNKSSQSNWNPVYMDHDPSYIKNFYRQQDERGVYRLDHIIRSASMGARPNLSYEYKGYKPEWGWRVIQEKLEQLDNDNRLEWSKTGRPYLKRYLHEQKGTPIKSVITDIQPIQAQAAELLGYPTQKPEALLERIIKASSNEGDIVLDPFCGCGTAIAVAERLHRRWIGIDITHLAITLMRHRLQNAFGQELSPYEVQGDPKDVGSARELAQQDRYKFEWWALGLVDARPAQDKKKGADSGIDGYINFFDDESGKAKTIVVQVKSGHVQRNQIATLKGDMERENAPIGLFITLEEPTKPMTDEAIATGFYTPDHFPDLQFPKIQILTIEDLLEGTKQPEYPRMAPSATFKRAQRRSKSKDQQGQLI